MLWFRINLDKIDSGELVEEPILIALADSINRFSIEIDHLRDLISGMEDDLYETNYYRFEDLRQYCYRAASTVGLCLVEIYGYDDPNARRHAVEMGKYLQMVNVLRDIQEDLDRNRVYLPLEELAKFGLTKDDLHDEKLPQSEAWQEFMRHYLAHVMSHRKNAIGLLPLLDKDSRYSPSLMCAAYDAILEEAMKRNGDVLSSETITDTSTYWYDDYAYRSIRGNAQIDSDGHGKKNNSRPTTASGKNPQPTTV